MKLKATFNSYCCQFVLAACDQSGSAAKENAKAEHKTFQVITHLYTVQRKHHSSFSPALVMEGTSYNASSQQVYNRLVEFKKVLLTLSQPWLKVGRSVTMV